MNKDGLLSLLKERRDAPHKPARLFPTSFDASDARLDAFPRSLNWRWVSMERFLRYHDAKVVLMRLPLFWQVLTPLHHACRASGAAIYPNEPENVPVAGAAVRSADADAVITEARDAEALYAYLADKGLRQPAWFLVHRPEEPWSVPRLLSGVRLWQEVHLFPGVPLLEQCGEIAGSARFHPSDAYLWDASGAATRITSAGEDLIPLRSYELPFALRHEGNACSCGRLIVYKP